MLIDMTKTEIIKKIKEMLNREGDRFFSFAFKCITFTYDYGKHDLMAIYIDEDTDKLMVEAVKYSGFGLTYINAENLSVKTLQMIMDRYMIYSDIWD